MNECKCEEPDLALAEDMPTEYASYNGKLVCFHCGGCRELGKESFAVIPTRNIVARLKKLNI